MDECSKLPFIRSLEDALHESSGTDSSASEPIATITVLRTIIATLEHELRPIFLCYLVFSAYVTSVIAIIAVSPPLVCTRLYNCAAHTLQVVNDIWKLDCATCVT